MAIGKTAIVTGAGTGIGKAVATALLKAGWNTVFAGRRQALLEEAVACGRQDRGARRWRSPATSPRPDEVDRLFDGAARNSAASTCCSTMPAAASRRR